MIDVRDFGADEKMASVTANIQSAIDACHEIGGGEVVIPRGIWNISTLWLRSGVTLKLLSGAVLRGSKNPDDYSIMPKDIAELEPDYPYSSATDPKSRWHNSMIRALKAENIAIVGEPDSLIDGVNCYDELGEEGYRGPHAININSCRGVRLSGYTVRDSANWAHNIVATNDLEINGVTVLGGHDGIDIFICRNVKIENCVLHTGDDCIAGYGSVGVDVRNCEFSTACSVFRFGGANVTVTDCHQSAPARYGHRLTLSESERRSGASSAERGRKNTLTAFLYYSDSRYKHLEPAGNITFKNVVFDSVDSAFHLNFGNHMWCCESPLHSIRFENCVMRDICEPTYVYSGKGVPFTLEFSDTELHSRRGFGDRAIIDGAMFTKIKLYGVKLFGFEKRIITSSCDGVIEAASDDAFEIRRVEYVVNKNSH